MRFRLRVLAALGCLAMIAGSSAAYSATIYSDDFSGLGTDPLNGAAPDVRPGTETWSAATTNGWFANGSHSTGSSTATAGFNAFLPFTPAAGQIYTLSATLNPSGVSVGTNTGDWFAFGFAPSAATTTAQWNTGHTVASGGWLPWTFLRVNRTNSTAIVFGGGDVLTPAPTGAVDLKIVLNTQGAQWTAEYFVGGAVTPTSSLTFGVGENPPIGQVGFGAYRAAIGTVDNFSLTVVPEPNSIILAFLSATALGFIRTRRTRQAG